MSSDKKKKIVPKFAFLDRIGMVAQQSQVMEDCEDAEEFTKKQSALTFEMKNNIPLIKTSDKKKTWKILTTQIENHDAILTAIAQNVKNEWIKKKLPKNNNNNNNTNNNDNNNNKPQKTAPIKSLITDNHLLMGFPAAAIAQEINPVRYKIMLLNNLDEIEAKLKPLVREIFATFFANPNIGQLIVKIFVYLSQNDIAKLTEKTQPKCFPLRFEVKQEEKKEENKEEKDKEERVDEDIDVIEKGKESFVDYYKTGYFLQKIIESRVKELSLEAIEDDFAIMFCELAVEDTFGDFFAAYKQIATNLTKVVAKMRLPRNTTEPQLKAFIKNIICDRKGKMLPFEMKRWGKYFECQGLKDLVQTAEYEQIAKSVMEFLEPAVAQRIQNYGK
eukprot:247766_1